METCFYFAHFWIFNAPNCQTCSTSSIDIRLTHSDMRDVGSEKWESPERQLSGDTPWNWTFRTGLEIEVSVSSG